MPAVAWYYAKGSKQYGPVSPGELRQLADKGDLGGDDPVWRDGMDDWVPARKVKGLFDADAKAAESSPAKASEATPARAAEAVVKTVEGSPVKGEAPPVKGEATPVKGTEEPLNKAEPTEVAAAGEISADVAGTEPWKMPGSGAASATFERSPAAFERSLEGDSYHLFDHLLAVVRRRFTARFAEATARLFKACGHYGLYAATVMLLAYHGILAVKAGRASDLFWGAAEAVVLVLFQYTAIRMSGALERLVRTVTGRVVSTVFLDCFALLSMIGGLVALVALTLLAVERLDFFWIIPGVATFILGQYLASVALNPETLNLTITSEGDPADEAIGIVGIPLETLAPPRAGRDGRGSSVRPRVVRLGVGRPRLVGCGKRGTAFRAQATGSRGRGRKDFRGRSPAGCRVGQPGVGN